MNTLDIFLFVFNIVFFIFNLSELNWVIKRRKMVIESLDEARDNLAKSQKHLDEICELRDEALISFGKTKMLCEFTDRASVKLPNIKNRPS